MTSVPREPGITKLFTGHDWPSMIEDMAGHLTTFFERGGIKQAASDLFSRKDLDDHAPPPGFFMIHQTVMGNEEKYGFNNNGDSYPHEGLLRDHPTFVTHGKVYREHRNRSKEQAIGSIKAARYSHKLGRVELLKHVEIAKAEKEYDMAKAGKTLCASMSVRIPYDECSCCLQQSKYSSLYCTHLRDHMRQWMPSFKKYAFARNPRGTYFDSSIVANPADRTARHIEYRFGPDLLKAASANVVLTGEQWAEFEGVNLDDRLEVDAPTGAMLRKLAALEDDGMYKAANWRVHGTSQSFLPEPKHITPEQWHVLTRLQPGTLFNKLAKRQVLLPFADFCSYTTGRSVDDLQDDPDFAKSASVLPSVFRAIADALDNGGCGCCQQDVDMFRASGNGFASMDSGSCDEVDQIMDDVADEHSVDAAKLPQRVIRITVIKKASEASRLFGPALPAADLPPLVLLYGMYKAAACLDMQTLVPGIKSHVIEAAAVDQQLVQNSASNG